MAEAFVHHVCCGLCVGACPAGCIETVART